LKHNFLRKREFKLSNRISSYHSKFLEIYHLSKFLFSKFSYC